MRRFTLMAIGWSLGVVAAIGVAAVIVGLSIVFLSILLSDWAGV